MFCKEGTEKGFIRDRSWFFYASPIFHPWVPSSLPFQILLLP